MVCHIVRLDESLNKRRHFTLHPVPIVLRDSERRRHGPLQEALLDRMHPTLERKSVLEGMIGKGDFAVSLSHARQEKLDSLLRRRSRERSAAHGGEHLGAPIVVGNRDHAA